MTKALQHVTIWDSNKELTSFKTCYKTKFCFRHALKDHFTGKIHKCHCGSVFRGKPGLKYHQKTHSGEFYCQLCSESFDHAGKLSYHLEKKHPNRKKLKQKRSKSKFSIFVNYRILQKIPIILFYSFDFQPPQAIHVQRLWCRITGPKIIHESFPILSLAEKTCKARFHLWFLWILKSEQKSFQASHVPASFEDRMQDLSWKIFEHWKASKSPQNRNFTDGYSDFKTWEKFWVHVAAD